jgi:hypothetical protein
MNARWRRTGGILLRSLIILAVLLPISLWLSIAPIYILLLLITTLGLWQKKDKLSSPVNRARGMIGIVFGAFVLLGIITGWISGDLNEFFILILGGVLIILLTLALNR